MRSRRWAVRSSSVSEVDAPETKEGAVSDNQVDPHGSECRDHIHDLVDRIGTAVVTAVGEGTMVPEDAARLLSSAVRLYASQWDGGNEGSSSIGLVVTPTEAVIAASALLRSQQLTPFEFAIWFSGQGYAGGMEAGS